MPEGRHGEADSCSVRRDQVRHVLMRKREGIADDPIVNFKQASAQAQRNRVHRIADPCLLVLKHHRVPVTQEYMPELFARIKTAGQVPSINPESRATYLNLTACICFSFPNCYEQTESPFVAPQSCCQHHSVPMGRYGG